MENTDDDKPVAANNAFDKTAEDPSCETDNDSDQDKGGGVETIVPGWSIGWMKAEKGMCSKEMISLIKNEFSKFTKMNEESELSRFKIVTVARE